jgi:hypothetical protein
MTPAAAMAAVTTSIGFSSQYASHVSPSFDRPPDSPRESPAVFDVSSRQAWRNAPGTGESPASSRNGMIGRIYKNGIRFAKVTMRVPIASSAFMDPW